MDEKQDVSWRQAWQRKITLAGQIDRQVTHLLFLMSLGILAAVILYFLPTTGTALVVTSVGGTVLVLLSLAVGLRAAWIHSRAQKQVATYRKEMDLPPPPEPASSQLVDRILRWCFRGFAMLAAFVAAGEIALLWQEQPASRGHLIVLVVTLVTAAIGFMMARLMASPTPPKPTNDSPQK
jgi:hypothetical protein